MNRLQSVEPYNSDNDHPSYPGDNRKRSSRACDQCRKTKSKCEPSEVDGLPCRSCAASGIECLYIGPSFKRGPPKGYIHALERRLHEVEALLGTIICSSDPRARSLISELSKDPLAENIVHRVKVGPFGPVGAFNETTARKEKPTNIMGVGDPEQSESSRLARQSRQLRERISWEDSNVTLPRPTSQWQGDLLHRLASSTDAATSAKNQSHSPCHVCVAPKSQMHWDGMYTFDDSEGQFSARTWLNGVVMSVCRNRYTKRRLRRRFQGREPSCG